MPAEHCHDVRQIAALLSKPPDSGGFFASNRRQMEGFGNPNVTYSRLLGFPKYPTIALKTIFETVSGVLIYLKP